MNQDPVPSPVSKPASAAEAAAERRAEASVWVALQLAWELGYLIAIPAVIFAFSGAWMDKKFATSPLFLVAGFLLAFTISTIGVVRKVRSITSK